MSFDTTASDARSGAGSPGSTGPPPGIVAPAEEPSELAAGTPPDEAATARQQYVPGGDDWAPHQLPGG